MHSPKPNAIVRLLPSLTDVAFALPLVMLLSRMGGVNAMLRDGDTGWHIRTGEWILANGRVPYADMFSFTRSGQPWFAWEWMWDVLFAALYRQGGLAAVALTSILVVCLTSALLFRYLRKKTNALLAMIITVLATGGTAIHWLARPHLFTVLFTVIFLTLLDRAREGGGRLPRWMGGLPCLAALPLLTIVWTNLHGGFVVGISLAAAYAAGEWLRGMRAAEERPWAAAWQRARSYVFAAAGCAAASLVNPYSFQLHRHIAAYLTGSYEAANITEFLSLSFHHPLAPFFEAMLVLGIAALFWNAGRGRYEYSILVAVWGHGALLAARNIPIFAVVAAPAVAVMAQEWLAGAEAQGLPAWLRRIKDAALHAAAVLDRGEEVPRVHAASAAAILLLAALVYAPSAEKAFRPEYDPKSYPEKALESASLAGADARIFTSDEWGDYLIFRLYDRGTRVFIDGRSDFYGEDFGKQFLDTWRARNGWQKTLDRYGVNAILVPPDAALAAVLRESSRWRVVYDDGVAMVFRPARENRAGDQASVVEVNSGAGRDREITKTQARDRTITQSQSKPTT